MMNILGGKVCIFDTSCLMRSGEAKVQTKQPGTFPLCMAAMPSILKRGLIDQKW